MPDLEDLSGWTWETIEELRGTTEGQRIECKRKMVPAKPVLDEGDVDKLAKAVSSFANSGGGLYLLGVDARENGKGSPDTILGAVPIADLPRCLASVKARLSGIVDPPVRYGHVRAIENPGTGTGVIAVPVEGSEFGPHRVAVGSGSGRYYVRSDDGTALMNHTTLALHFGKTPQPKLVLLVTYAANVLALRVRNDGKGTARHVTIILDNPPGLAGGRSISSCNQQDGFRVVYDPRLSRTSRVGYASDSLVLFPGYDVDVYTFESVPAYANGIRLSGCLYAADATPRPFNEIVKPWNDAYELPTENAALDDSDPAT